VAATRKRTQRGAPGTTRLEVEIVNVARAPVARSFVGIALEHAAQVPEVAARLPDPPASVAVRLTGDKELRRLNRMFAGIDSPTDVLSFGGQWRAGSLEKINESDHHLGDIAISWPMVVRQADEFDEPVETELALLSVHGLLHLLGWDHDTTASNREMTRLTRAALKLSGLKVAAGRL
jgi:probable rRNA maturation factor